MRAAIIYLILISLPLFSRAQQVVLSGEVRGASSQPVAGARVCLSPDNICAITDSSGFFTLTPIRKGNYQLSVSGAGYNTYSRQLKVADSATIVQIELAASAPFRVLDSIQVRSGRQSFGLTRLKDVDGTGIYAGKKSEVIVLKDVTANKATNNARQLYSKVSGLNIYENDGGAGIQLAIGGRGLDPNRVSNFNTRQNGYDISADALGYPESYYTPPAELLEKIEIVRGAASLQYGTQFGGIINFKMNSAPDSGRMQVITRLTYGSWNFFNTSTSIGGTSGKWNYYAFYQHKSGDGWRPNAQFNVNTAYLSGTLKATSRLSVTAQYTHMDYLEQQSGGLSDAMFAADPRQSTKARNWFKVNWNLGAVLLDYQIAHNLTFNSRFFGLLADRSALGVINTVTDPGDGWPRNYRTDHYANWGNESRLVYTYHNRHAHPFTLLGGVRYYSSHTNRQIGYGNDGSGGTKADFAFDKSTPLDSLSYSKYIFPNQNVALFAENIFRLSSKWSIIPGMRYENIVTRANGFYNIVGADLAGNVTSNEAVVEHRVRPRSFLIAGVGLSYEKSSAVQLYANFSQNYRGINFNDMSIVYPNAYVDPNLQDEKGYSADIGIRGHLTDIFTYDLSLFAIHYNDRIGVIQIDSMGIDARYTTNISQSRNYGLESYAEVDIWKLIKGSGASMKLAVFTNLSYIDARYVGSEETAYRNKKVEFVPPVILKTGLTFQKGKVAATYQYAYTARQYGDATNSEQSANNGIIGPVNAYTVMDFTAEYRCSRLFTFTGTINNLSNAAYFTRRADSYPGPGIIPADPRSFYLTVQVKL